jgi:hypothetical protein
MEVFCGDLYDPFLKDKKKEEDIKKTREFCEKVAELMKEYELTNFKVIKSFGNYYFSSFYS